MYVIKWIYVVYKFLLDGTVCDTYPTIFIYSIAFEIERTLVTRFAFGLSLTYYT